MSVTSAATAASDHGGSRLSNNDSSTHNRGGEQENRERESSGTMQLLDRLGYGLVSLSASPLAAEESATQKSVRQGQQRIDEGSYSPKFGQETGNFPGTQGGLSSSHDVGFLSEMTGCPGRCSGVQRRITPGMRKRTGRCNHVEKHMCPPEDRFVPTEPRVDAAAIEYCNYSTCDSEGICQDNLFLSRAPSTNDSYGTNISHLSACMATKTFNLPHSVDFYGLHCSTTLTVCLT